MSEDSSGIVTEEDLSLSFFVEDSQWQGVFDSLEVWRSRTGEKGLYENLTAPSWSPARFPDGAADAPAVPASGPSANIVDKDLLLRVNEDVDLTITFTGANPLAYAQAAIQIATQSQGLLKAWVVAGHLVLETVTAGAGAVIRIVGGDAAPLLGLPTTGASALSFGREARVRLVAGKNSYAFTDQNGSSDYYYKTRFFNGVDGTASEFSAPFTGSGIAGLDAANTVRATVDLVDAQGDVLVNRAVLLHCLNQGSRISGKTVIDSELQVLTDSAGHAEFILVRGQHFTVAIGGTDVVRDFTTPTDTSILTFDMLDPAYSSDDVFTVQAPTLDYAVRRST